MSRLRSIAGALCAMLLLLVPAEGAEVTLTAMVSVKRSTPSRGMLRSVRVMGCVGCLR